MSNVLYAVRVWRVKGSYKRNRYCLPHLFLSVTRCCFVFWVLWSFIASAWLSPLVISASNRKALAAACYALVYLFWLLYLLFVWLSGLTFQKRYWDCDSLVIILQWFRMTKGWLYYCVILYFDLSPYFSMVHQGYILYDWLNIPSAYNSCFDVHLRFWTLHFYVSSCNNTVSSLWSVLQYVMLWCQL